MPKLFKVYGPIIQPKKFPFPNHGHVNVADSAPVPFYFIRGSQVRFFVFSMFLLSTLLPRHHDVLKMSDPITNQPFPISYCNLLFASFSYPVFQSYSKYKMPFAETPSPLQAVKTLKLYPTCQHRFKQVNQLLFSVAANLIIAYLYTI